MQKGASRAYSTNFEDHKGLLHRLASKGWGRLQEAGVVIEYMEVFQEMSLIFCKAAQNYDPTKGFTFTAYLGQAVWNDFNKVAEKLINEQCGLGLVRIGDLGEADMDAYEMIRAPGLSPEEEVMGARSFMDTMKTLHSDERKVVAGLIRQVIKPRAGESVPEMSISDVMAQVGMNRAQAARARQRIGDAFGVNLKGAR